MKASLRFLTLAALAGASLLSACTPEEDSYTPLAEYPISWKNRQLEVDTNTGYFFAPLNGLVYKARDSANFNTNRVDFSLVANDSARLVSLNVRGRNNFKPVIRVLRNTSIVKINKTKANMDTLTNAGIRSVTVALGRNTIALQDSTVYAFNTTENKRGWLYVHQIRPSAKGIPNGAIVFDVKLEK